MVSKFRYSTYDMFMSGTRKDENLKTKHRKRKRQMNFMAYITPLLKIKLQGPIFKSKNLFLPFYCLHKHRSILFVTGQNDEIVKTQ